MASLEYSARGRICCVGAVWIVSERCPDVANAGSSPCRLCLPASRFAGKEGSNPKQSEQMHTRSLLPLPLPQLNYPVAPCSQLLYPLRAISAPVPTRRWAGRPQPAARWQEARGLLCFPRHCLPRTLLLNPYHLFCPLKHQQSACWHVSGISVWPSINHLMQQDELREIIGLNFTTVSTRILTFSQAVTD